MVFFAGVHGGNFSETIDGPGYYDKGCFENCRFFCAFDGGRDAKNLDKMRYKVTKAEAAWYLNKFDVDGNKLLDKSEVRALLDSIEQIPDPAFAVEGNDHVMSIPKVNDVELDLLMRLTSDESESILRVPAQRVGRLLVLHRYLSRNRALINATFARYDTSGDDHLDARELTHFLKTIDPRATTDELASLINQLFTIDKDNDGKISRAELLVSVGYWKELVAAQRAAAARKHMCACCRGSEPVMPEVAVAGTPILVLPADAVVVVVAQPLEMKR